MTDHPDVPDVVAGEAPGVTGAVALVLWTVLTRRLVDAQVLSGADLKAVMAEAHAEFAKDADRDPAGAEAAMALLARLSMNAL